MGHDSEGFRASLDTHIARPLSLTYKALALLLLLGGLLVYGGPQPALAQVAPVCTPPPSGMVSWWGGDGNPNDIIGTNHGTLQAGATYAGGKVGQAFNFSGAQDSYVEVADAPNLNPAGSFTIDGWFYIDPATMTGGKTDAVLASKTNGDSSDGGWQLVFVTGRNGWTNALRFLVMGGGQYPSAILNNAIVSAGWHHVSGVYDAQAPGTVKLYLDGTLAASDSSGVTMANNTRNVRIGASYWSDFFGGNDRLNGMADEVEIFNRALTAEEIAAIYNAGSAGKCRSCVTPPPNMVSWWDAEGDANDIIGTNHGTLVNGATFATGKVGQAFSFDGVNDHVEVPDSPSLDITSAITIDAWIYRNGGDTEEGIVEKGVPGTNGVYELAIFANALYFRLNGADLNMPSNISILFGIWTHVAGTYDGITAKIYINGVLNTSQPYSSPIGTDNNPLYIGLYGTATKHFKGQIDELEIFDRALSAEEIAAIANAGSAGKCKCVAPPSGMVSWWGGDGNPNDIIGTNHGTLVNGATFASGKVGQAFSFDGVNDYVDLGSSTAFDLADFTLDAWVYIDSSTNTGERRLISRDDWTVEGADGREYYILKSSSSTNCGVNNRPYVEINAGGIASICSPSDLTTGWHYLAATRSGTTLKLYVDGAEVASTTAGTGIISPDAPLVIGTINPTQNIENFIGLVDEVEVFNRALSAEEIAAIANAGSAGKCRSCVTPPSGMVSWWGGDGNPNDIIGTNHGTMVNGATFAPGKVGQAFSLDGANAVVQVPNDSAWNFGANDFTIDTWVNFNSTAGFPIFAAHDEGASAQNKWIFWLSGGSLAFHINGTNGSFNLGVPFAPTTGQWYHVAVTRSGGDTYKFYVDGAQRGTNQIDSTVIPDANAFLTIGKGEEIASLNGLLDEVEIFNRALSAEEIAAVANAGSAGKCQATDDTTPDPFTFTDLTGVPLSTVQTSNAITVSGITAPAAISIVGGEYELGSNPGVWTSSDGTVSNSDTVRVRHTSAATYSTAVDTTLTIGGVSDTFTSTTLGHDLTGAWDPVSQICRRGRCTLLGSVRIWNQGIATAPRSRLRVILSDDAVMDSGDTILREENIGRIRPGQSQTRWVNVRLPRGVNASGKYLFAVIDALNGVAETNETNNAPMYGPIP